MSMVAGVADNDPMKIVRMLISDPEGLKRQLEQFERSKASAQAVIDLVGPAGEILTLRKQTEEARSLAIDAVVVARKKAVEIVAQANKKAEGIVSESLQTAGQRLDAIIVKERQTEDLRSKAQTALTEIQRDKEALEGRLAEARGRVIALSSATASMESKQAELDQRIGQLEKARTALQSILAG